MDKISYDDFLKLDLRIAKIESTENIPGKTRIIKGIISLGDEKRDVIIGGANFYDPEELVGRLVVVIVNLEPKKMAGIESNAMLLAMPKYVTVFIYVYSCIFKIMCKGQCLGVISFNRLIMFCKAIFKHKPGKSVFF